MKKGLLIISLVFLVFFIVDCEGANFSKSRDCVDLDGDSFYSNLFGCGEQDCNDEFNFYNPDTGEYCLEENYFFLDPTENYYAQDFALIEDDFGNIHTYYIKFPPGTNWQTDPDCSMDFGHESSNDLINWDSYGDVIEVSEFGNWDDEHVWAPSVVYNPVDGLYYMYYTGVTDGFTQNPSNHKERIGLATSNDLINWEKYPLNLCDGTTGEGCIWDCNLSWTAWGEIEGNWTYQCRDPQIFYDDGNWYMVYSTVKSPFDWRMIIGLAKSPDLINWEDLGPIENTLFGKAESAHLVKNEGEYYLFFTSSLGSYDSIFYINASDLESGPWSSKTQLDGVEFNSIASEFLKLNNQNLFAYIYPYGRIRFKELSFDAGISLKSIFSPDCSFIDPSLVFPGAEEILLNGLDDDCDGLIDEEGCVDSDLDGYGTEFNSDCVHSEIDCNDNNRWINPSAREICGNDIDENCNGRINDRCKFDLNYMLE